MRTSLSSCFFLSLALLASLSFTQGLDGSGLDLESSASGDESEDGSTADIILEDNRRSDDLSIIYSTPDETDWIFLDSSKSPLENPEVLAVVIAGGILGGVLAVAVISTVIYKWQKNEKKKIYML